MWQKYVGLADRGRERVGTARERAQARGGGAARASLRRRASSSLRQGRLGGWLPTRGGSATVALGRGAAAAQAALCAAASIIGPAAPSGVATTCGVGGSCGLPAACGAASTARGSSRGSSTAAKSGAIFVCGGLFALMAPSKRILRGRAVSCVMKEFIRPAPQRRGPFFW